MGLVRASADEYSEVGPTGNWNPDNSYKETPLDRSSPQPFPEQLTQLSNRQLFIMPKARSDNNYVIGDRHITRTALTLHTAVLQSYNELGRFVIPHSRCQGHSTL